MSVQAMGWVLDHSPASGNALVLHMVMANRADEDGRGVYFSVGTLAERSRLSERAVQTHLRWLERQGLIAEDPDDPRVADIPIHRRPRCWRLVMERGAESAPGADTRTNGVKPAAPETLEETKVLASKDREASTPTNDKPTEEQHYLLTDQLWEREPSWRRKLTHGALVKLNREFGVVAVTELLRFMKADLVEGRLQVEAPFPWMRSTLESRAEMAS